ncbi:uncharacterized protein [Fopius arisanus]|uniref:Uncharacterized protein n=1 Tax=Fopius arisanus TaxID=64838 RepID=A0A9R1T1H2_9HYME|nr:PREDICTED: uncharacterized protein LOC105265281 [Fopius arisanus]
MHKRVFYLPYSLFSHVYPSPSSPLASSSEQQFCLRWNNHRTNLLTAFSELFHNGAFTDVELLVEGLSGLVPFKCHKMVLAACSLYFQEIFSYASTDQYPIIVLTNVREPEMKAILEFMYQGEVNVSQDEMAEIFRVARMLKIKGLVEYDKSHEPRDPSDSPPPAISSTERTASINESIHNDYRSPPHSTSASSYFPGYGKGSGLMHNPAGHIPPPGWSPLASLSLAAQSVMNAPLTPRAAALFPGVYDTEANHIIRKQMNSLMLNRDTPILRTVLGQGQADSSQILPPSHADPHDLYRSSSNGSAHEIDDRKSMDLSHRNSSGHSPFSADVSFEEFDKKSGQQNRKNKEWKRYKQYTKEHMEKAIIAVKGGETALKASKAYGIPSRTLYDKVKKMGITTQRNIRRHRTSSGAHFPHGIGGNRNGGIYRGMSDIDNDNDYSNSMMEGSAALMDIAYSRGRDQSEDHEASFDHSRISTSPDEEPREEIKYENEDDVQDLSINRRNVIVPPSNPPAKEEDDASKN